MLLSKPPHPTGEDPHPIDRDPHPIKQAPHPAERDSFMDLRSSKFSFSVFFLLV